MNAISFGAIARERLDIVPYRPKADNSPDTAWVVLEAANDLGDDATIDACRRVIDANLNGTPASQSDLHTIRLAHHPRLFQVIQDGPGFTVTCCEGGPFPASVYEYTAWLCSDCTKG